MSLDRQSSTVRRDIYWAVHLLGIVIASTANVSAGEVNEQIEDQVNCAALFKNVALIDVIKSASSRAMRQWPDVKRRFEAGLPKSHYLFVSFMVHDGRGNSEYLFLLVDSISDGHVSGRVWTEARAAEEINSGDELEIVESMLVDWVITGVGGSEEGNMVEKAVDKYDACQADQ